MERARARQCLPGQGFAFGLLLHLFRGADQQQGKQGEERKCGLVWD